MTIMVDKNPSDQPEIKIPLNVVDMVNIQKDEKETGNLYENFWACPDCLTDADLIDVIEESQLS